MLLLNGSNHFGYYATGTIQPTSSYIFYARHNTEEFGSTEEGYAIGSTKAISRKSSRKYLCVGEDGTVTVNLGDMTGIEEVTWEASSTSNFEVLLDKTTSTSNFFSSWKAFSFL